MWPIRGETKLRDILENASFTMLVKHQRYKIAPANITTYMCVEFTDIVIRWVERTALGWNKSTKQRLKRNSNNRTYNKKSNKKGNTQLHTQALSVVFGQRATHGSFTFPKFSTFGRWDCLLDSNLSAGSLPWDISPPAGKALSVSKLNTTTCSLPDRNDSHKCSHIKLQRVRRALKTLMTGPLKTCSMSQQRKRDNAGSDCAPGNAFSECVRRLE